jgi:WD40 repeat protein
MRGFRGLNCFHSSSRLAAISSDDTVTINDVDSDNKALLSVGRSHRPLAIAFSPDGRWVATGGKDSSVKVWDLHTKALLRTFKGHGTKSLVCFSSSVRRDCVSHRPAAMAL